MQIKIRVRGKNVIPHSITLEFVSVPQKGESIWIDNEECLIEYVTWDKNKFQVYEPIIGVKSYKGYREESNEMI